MSKIGNIYNSYGNTFNIAIANASSEAVLNAVKLPVNTLIVAAPFDSESNTDYGTCSLIITDSEGAPSRLTYCVKEGNGLHDENGMLAISIDDASIKEIDSKLSVDVSKLVANDTVRYSNGKLSVDVSKLAKTSASSFGTAKVDDATVKSDNGRIYVETSRLDLASSSSSGICIGDRTTVKAVQGKLSVLTNGLSKALESSYGICKADDDSTKSNDGVISLDETYFMNDGHVGLVKADGTSVTSSNGVLSISSSGISKASATTAGTVTLGSEFYTSSNGQVSVTGTTANVDVSRLQGKLDNINARLDVIEENLASL